MHVSSFFFSLPFLLRFQLFERESPVDSWQILQSSIMRLLNKRNLCLDRLIDHIWNWVLESWHMNLVLDLCLLPTVFSEKKILAILEFRSTNKSYGVCTRKAFTSTRTANSAIEALGSTRPGERMPIGQIIK